MKIKIYLLAFLALLVACVDEVPTRVAAETLAVVESKNKAIAATKVVKNVNIKDIFLLLPDDVFPLEGISIANRKRLLNHIGEDAAFAISATPIEVCDVKNGFLSLNGTQFAWEMTYWNIQEGRKLVAINQGTEAGSKVRVFFYHNGKLTEDPDYQLGGQQNYTLTDFFDIEQLSAGARKYAQQQFAQGAYDLYYQLPQKGTSLTLGIDAYLFMLDDDEGFEIPDEAIKSVTLKWKNDKWER